MSFRDFAPPHLVEQHLRPGDTTSSPNRNGRSRRRSSPPPHRSVVSPSPTNPLDQIALALKEHRQDRNMHKEKSLMLHSTTVARYNSPAKVTTFSKLNDEIVSFQKLVNEFCTFVESDAVSPEEQWRIQILQTSLHDLERDLVRQIEESPWNQHDLAVKASFSKLKRDLERIRKQYRTVVKTYRRKQHAEAAILTSQPILMQQARPTNHSRRSRGQQRRQQQQLQYDPTEEADFFTKAMNEEENRRINAQMHQVNQIYEDLGKIVENQQENFDKIEDNIRYARANAEVGLEHLQDRASRNYACGADDLFPNASYRAGGGERSRPDFSTVTWSTPFETMQEDWMEVKSDLEDLMKKGAKQMRRMPATCGYGGAHIGDDYTYATGYSSSYKAEYTYSDPEDDHSILA